MVDYSGVNIGDKMTVYISHKNGTYDEAKGRYCGTVGRYKDCVMVRLGFMRHALIDAKTGWISGIGRTQAGACMHARKGSENGLNMLLYLMGRPERAKKLADHLDGKEIKNKSTEDALDDLFTAFAHDASESIGKCEPNAKGHVSPEPEPTPATKTGFESGEGTCEAKSNE